MNFQGLVRLLSLTIGVFYICTGITKALDITAFADIVSSILPHSQLYIVASAIVGLEIMLGFCLLFGVMLKQIGRFSFIYLIFVSVAYTLAYFAIGLDDYGCFGTVLKTSVGVTFLIYILLAIGSILIWKKAILQNNLRRQSLELVVSLLFGFVAFVILSFELKNTYSILSVKVGTNLSNTFLDKHIKINGYQILFIFSPSSKRCLTLMDSINAINFEKDNLLGLYSSLESQDDIDYLRYKKRPKFIMIPENKDSLRTLTRTLPTFLVLKNGIVKNIYHNELPPFYEFTESPFEK